MPVDPNISLDIKPATVTGPDLGTISSYADVQNKLNENRLFQQTYAARQAAGQIIAAAPDVDTGIKNLQADPNVAAFAPEVAQNLAATKTTLTSYQGDQQKQSQDGLHSFMQSLPAVMADPSQWGAMVSANLATLSPSARARVAPAMEAIRAGLTDGLPDDPDAAKAEFNKRLGGVMIAGGVGPDAINGILGTPAEESTGRAINFGLKAPAQGSPAGAPGGSFTPAGQAPTNSLEMGLPPSIQNIPNPKGGATTAIVHDTGAPGIQPLGSSPTTAQAGVNEGSAETAKELTAGANTINDSLPTRINALDSMVDAMKRFQAGGGAPERQSVATFAQALKNMGAPVDQTTIDKIGNGSLDASQYFNTQLKPMMVKQLSSDAHGSGRVMLPEVDAYLHILSTATDPKAIIGALNQIKYGYQVGYDKAQKWSQFRQDPGKDPADFQADYTKSFDRSKLPTKAGDLSLLPYDASKVKGGATAPGVTHIWDPKQRKIIPVGGQ